VKLSTNTLIDSAIRLLMLMLATLTQMLSQTSLSLLALIAVPLLRSAAMLVLMVVLKDL